MGLSSKYYLGHVTLTLSILVLLYGKFPHNYFDIEVALWVLVLLTLLCVCIISILSELYKATWVFVGLCMWAEMYVG